MLRLSAIRNMLQHPNVQSPINPTPSSVPQGYMDSYSTLGQVGGGNRRGGATLIRVTMTHANRALVYPSQGGRCGAEGRMALDSNSCVVNNPLGEPGRTPLYVGFPSAWGSVDGDSIFSPFSWKGPLTGDS